MAEALVDVVETTLFDNFNFALTLSNRKIKLSMEEFLDIFRETIEKNLRPKEHRTIDDLIEAFKEFDEIIKQYDHPTLKEDIKEEEVVNDFKKTISDAALKLRDQPFDSEFPIELVITWGNALDLIEKIMENLATNIKKYQLKWMIEYPRRKEKNEYHPPLFKIICVNFLVIFRVFEQMEDYLNDLITPSNFTNSAKGFAYDFAHLAEILGRNHIVF